MRLVRYEHRGEARIGVAVDGLVSPTRFASMVDLIRSGELPEASDEPVRPDRILAPIERPGKILGSGINFKSHLTENPSATAPIKPGFFSKLPSAVVGPGDSIVIPTPESEVDYEVELAIVIGKTARHVPLESALDHVYGYTIVNDVSARDLQFAGDMLFGKGLDTFCPSGPAVVTVDELGDAANLRLTSFVNGERRQEASTAQWFFDVRSIISFLSANVTLEPGDIVTTGTPAGVGAFRRPPEYLKPGDNVVVEVEGLGRLENPVVGAWDGQQIEGGR